VSGWPWLLGGAYLAGSLSFSLLVVWLLLRIDVRTVGSGNAGATNVLRAAGRWPALLVLLLDIAKGIVPVQVAKRLGAPASVVAATAFAVLLGHVYPLYFGFRGGKGVATGFGAFVALFPLAAVSALLLFAIVVAATRYVSVGSLIAAASVPLFAWNLAKRQMVDEVSGPAMAWTVGMVALIAWRHRKNLARLHAGTERRLGRSKESER